MFYGKSRSLIFLNEDQYRERRKIYNLLKQREIERIEAIKERMVEKDFKFSRLEGSSRSSQDYVDQSSGQYIDGVYFNNSNSYVMKNENYSGGTPSLNITGDNSGEYAHYSELSDDSDNSISSMEEVRRLLKAIDN
jgi:hypothetical protein